MDWLLSGLAAGMGVFLATLIIEGRRNRLRRRNILALLLTEIESHVNILRLATHEGSEHVPEEFQLETDEWTRSKAELAALLDPHTFRSISWHYRSVSNLRLSMQTADGREAVNAVAAAALETAASTRDEVESLILPRKTRKHPELPGNHGSG